MLKTETINVLKQTFYFLLAVVALPVIMTVTGILRDTPFFQTFFPVFQFGLLFWALFMGISLFAAERGQRGMEYLLSLPYSRIRLIGQKVLPRAAVVLALYLVCLLLYTLGGANAAAFHIFAFSLLYFSLFCSALALSASSENFLVLFVFSLFSLAVFLGLLLGVTWLIFQAKGYVHFEFEIGSFFSEGADRILMNLIVPVAVGILMPLLFSLVLSFKKFDLRPVKTYNRRFLKVFIPLFFAGLIGSFVFAYQTLDTEYTDYFLTQDLQVVELNIYSGVKIYDKKRVHRVNGLEYYWPLWEEGSFVYFSDGNRVGRLNTLERTTEILYEAPREKRIDWRSWGYEQAMAFLERKRDYSGARLIFLDFDSGDAKKIPLAGSPLEKYSNWIIFGADTIEGQRFWLLFTRQGSKEEMPISLLWEDGRIEGIGESRKWPCYINRTLLSYSENEIIVSKHENGRFVTLMNIPNRDDLHFGWYVHSRKKLTNSPVKELYGRKVSIHKDEKNTGRTFSAHYARLNLDTFKIEELPDLKGSLTFYSPEADKHYVLERNDTAQEANLFKVNGGKLQLLKTFKSPNPVSGLKVLDISESGLLVKEGKKTKVYALQDLKEVKFKKL